MSTTISADRSVRSVPLEIVRIAGVPVKRSVLAKVSMRLPIVFVDERNDGVNSFNALMREFGHFGCPCYEVKKDGLAVFSDEYQGKFVLAGLYSKGLPLSNAMREHPSSIIGYAILIQMNEWDFTDKMRASIDKEIADCGFPFPVLPQSTDFTVMRIIRWMVDMFPEAILAA